MMVASFFANVMALASPLFVMQVLNRYVGQGVDATLVTLTSGVLIGIALEFAFRQSRLSMARGISVAPDEQTALDGFEKLTRAKVSALDQTPAETRKEIVNGTAAIESAYNANNITTIMDAPFSLLFIGVLYLLSPLISYVVLSFVVAVFLVGLLDSIAVQAKTSELQAVSGEGSVLLSTATREGDTIRSFNAGEFVRNAWQKHIVVTQKLRRQIAARQGLIQTFTQTSNGLMSTAVVTVAATLVVLGELDVGVMIGTNILAARALQPISKLAQMGSAFAKARDSIQLFKKLSAIEVEQEKGSALREYSGRLELRDIAFAFPGATTPMFESLSMTLEPGAILVVTGDNGSGKSTLARILLGLLDPIRGQVLIDGLDLHQVSPEWWRRQIIFQPQEPALLNATIQENLKINNPEVAEAVLNQVIELCGLRKFLDESSEGLETVITENGWRLSEGIRRRIALGRGLCTDGMLAIIDEPTESLDSKGAEAVHKILRLMAEQGKTIIVMSHDANIVKGNHKLLNLNEKPVPTVIDVGEDILDDQATGKSNLEVKSQNQTETRSNPEIRPLIESDTSIKEDVSGNPEQVSEDIPSLRLDPINHPIENPIPKISDHLIDELSNVGDSLNKLDTISAPVEEPDRGSEEGRHRTQKIGPGQKQQVIKK
jgi:ATP-binding cassette subfamily C protein LapB